MDHCVTVDRLPEDFQIPADLSDRISYDSQSRKLTHRGFMSKEEYDRLVELTNDWTFIRKIENLFQQCTLEEKTPPQNRLARIFASLTFRRT